MKYLVISNFIDKNTRELFKEGSLYSCSDESRANELIDKKFIKKQEKQAKARKSKKASDVNENVQ